MATKIMVWENGIRKISDAADVTAAVSASDGAEDAGEIVALNSEGLVDASMLPESTDFFEIETTENLASGDFVTVSDDAGTPKCALADPGDGVSGMAHGFVLASYTSGQTARVYYMGAPRPVTVTDGDWAAGADLYLGADGRATDTKSTTPGDINQRIGVAHSATAFFTLAELPVVVPAG